ncbi:carotenoid oxygenase family protein [Sandaracinobacter sp. RS1-74]|uniref:carotenoid oxygenase family protein n=1 Tax=Sandaracinobacteroides sayramensis TaxID=2913411 RepID=UPI001EDA7F40|nr:carotenoid oxygenase family protein [Sandaracinobacteroides sayramensis]MCG2840525.1 carotenoid oxygenase family protein [Sandaracinobacteroides sayramensis]
MTRDLPANPFLSGLWAPMRDELDLGELAVTGTIPADLQGHYYRMGPNPLRADPSFYHPFIGDGMVHGIAVSGGKALWYRNRFIRSHRVAEALGEEPAPGPRHGVADTVNTNVAPIAGQLYGLIESGSTPVALSADLRNQRYSDFGGTLAGAYSAHPHLDPLTGETHAVSYQWMEPGKAAHVVIDAAGKVMREEPLGLPHGPMIHDCAITRRFLILLDMPAAFVPEAAKAGSPLPYAWQPDLPCRVGLLPRNGTAADILWCEAPLSYVYHVANAYDADDGKVTLDVCAFETMFAEHPDRCRGLERWTIDPDARTISIRVIDSAPQEFPRIDERLLGRQHRWIHTLSQPRDPADTAPGGSALYRHDLESGAKEIHDFGEGRFPGEFMFVPKGADAAEQQGWLIGLVIDSRNDNTDLVILDAQAFEAEPVARIHIPHRVPPGFHGNWVAS